MKIFYLFPLFALPFFGCGPDMEVHPTPKVHVNTASQQSTKSIYDFPQIDGFYPDEILPGGKPNYPWGFHKESVPFWHKAKAIEKGATLAEAEKIMGRKGRKLPYSEKIAYGKSFIDSIHPENNLSQEEEFKQGRSKVQKADQYKWNDTVTKSYIIVEFPPKQDEGMTLMLEQSYTN